LEGIELFWAKCCIGLQALLVDIFITHLYLWKEILHLLLDFWGVLYSYLLLGIVLDWIFNPSNAATGFGFVLSELSNEGQNALIRDFTSFFLATFLFSLLGAITLNPAWFFSVAIIYFGAAIFNLSAIYIHGTGYNNIYLSEILLGLWPFILGIIIAIKKS